MPENNRSILSELFSRLTKFIEKIIDTIKEAFDEGITIPVLSFRDDEPVETRKTSENVKKESDFEKPKDKDAEDIVPPHQEEENHEEEKRENKQDKKLNPDEISEEKKNNSPSYAETAMDICVFGVSSNKNFDIDLMDGEKFMFRYNEQTNDYSLSVTDTDKEVFVGTFPPEKLEAISEQAKSIFEAHGLSDDAQILELKPVMPEYEVEEDIAFQPSVTPKMIKDAIDENDISQLPDGFSFVKASLFGEEYYEVSYHDKSIANYFPGEDVNDAFVVNNESSSIDDILNSISNGSFDYVGKLDEEDLEY